MQIEINMQAILCLLFVCAACQAQLIYHQPSILSEDYQPHYAAEPHATAINNALREAELPPELLKSHRFYSNPHTAAALAKASLLTNKEMPVGERESEKIPREMIFRLFRNAGWIKRR